MNNLPAKLKDAFVFVIGGTEDETGDLLDDLYKVQADLKDYIMMEEIILEFAAGLM